MSRIVTVQSNFTTGEIDPKIKSRVDLQQYYNGLDVAQNVTIQPQGGIQRRNGSEFVAEIPYQNEYDLKQFNSDVQVSYVGFSGTETIGRNGIWFKPDGTKMFATIVDDDSWVYTVNNPGIVEFTMSVAWDLSTLTYNAKTSDIAGIYARSGLSLWLMPVLAPGRGGTYQPLGILHLTLTVVYTDLTKSCPLRRSPMQQEHSIIRIVCDSTQTAQSYLLFSSLMEILMFISALGH